jgi:hypothetical protein
MKALGNVIFVDVDNLYIVDDKIDIPLLRKRVKAIKKLKKTTYWFGNTFTAKVVSQNNIDIDILDIEIETNSSDHNLINYMIKTKGKNLMVISADNILCKLAMFLNPMKTVGFARFQKYTNEMYEVQVGYDFKSREQLMNFMKSLSLYMKRY